MLFSTNPYVAGNPVGDSPAFVGRADILREVLQVLRHPNENAIVLYGQRRIGKTSVLQELEAKLPKQGNYYPIFFDLHDKAQWPLARVLCELAQKISDQLGQATPNLGDDPETTFHQWLPKLLNHLSQEASLVFLFDEFDVLDNPKSEKAAATFFPYLRDLLTINQKHLNFVFVIGRKVDDLTNIALSLLKTTPSVRVSLLNQQDTIELIRLSETNNSLIWSNKAIETVWQLTGGHPFLTQRLCSRIWERLYSDDPEKTPSVTPKEIEAAIPDTLSTSSNALEWLWGGLPPVERMIVSALASAGAKPVPKSQLENLLRDSGIQFVIQDLQTLQDWDLIEFVKDGYRFRVELLRRWIADEKPLSQVRKELDQIKPTADSLYQTGLGYYRVGNLDVSLTFLRQAVASNSNHVSANQLLAEILLAQRKISEAYEFLEKLYGHQPSVARSPLIRVLLILAQNNNSKKEQIKLYKRILELDAEHQEAKHKLQQILQLLQRRSKKKKSVIFPMIKSLIWVISTLGFGLLPLWLVLMYNLFTVETQIFFLFEHFIMSVASLFFLMAIFVPIKLDEFSFSTNDDNNLLEIMLVMGAILIIFLLLFWASLAPERIDERGPETFYLLKISILVLTLIFVTLAKLNIFRNSLQKFSTISLKSQWLVFLEILWKNVTWAIITYFLGLLPLWMILVFNFIMPSKTIPLAIFVIDGPLLFFATTIVSSITIDYWLSVTTPIKRYETFLFLIFPLLILFVCALLIYIVYGKEITEVNVELFFLTEQSILILVFFYSIVVKSFAFMRFLQKNIQKMQFLA